jgi:hypothetical protein
VRLPQLGSKAARRLPIHRSRKQRRELDQLLDEGLGPTEIKRITGWSRDTIYRHKRERLERRAAENAERKAAELHDELRRRMIESISNFDLLTWAVVLVDQPPADRRWLLSYLVEPFGLTADEFDAFDAQLVTRVERMLGERLAKHSERSSPQPQQPDREQPRSAGVEFRTAIG